MILVWSLIVWESSSGVENRLAAEHPGKQGNE